MEQVLEIDLEACVASYKRTVQRETLHALQQFAVGREGVERFADFGPNPYEAWLWQLIEDFRASL